MTGVLPAMRASRVNIVEALRGIKDSFKEKSSRNLALLGIVAIAAGVLVLLINGIFDKNYQAIWLTTGWDTLDEWRKHSDWIQASVFRHRLSAFTIH